MTGAFLFAAGLTSSMHCIGMCGGLPVLLGRGGGANPMARQVVYNLARVNTLVAIGAISGGVGYSLLQTAPIWLVERALPLVAGAFMLVVGLEMLGLICAVTTRLNVAVDTFIKAPLRAALQSKSVAAPVALGVFNAFLPCQLVYAFAAQAASTASVVDGMYTMLCFGLGTVPAMLAVGTASRLFPVSTRRWMVSISGLLVVGFALVTMARATVWTPETCALHGH